MRRFDLERKLLLNVLIFIFIPVAYSGNLYKSGLPSNFKDLYVDYIYGETIEDNASNSVTAATALSSPITSIISIIPTIIISLSGRLSLYINLQSLRRVIISADYPLFPLRFYCVVIIPF